jgi:hypothetical protein
VDYSSGSPFFNIATGRGEIYRNGGTITSPGEYPTLPQIGVSRATCKVGTTASGLKTGMEPSSGHTGAMVVSMTDGSVRTVSSGVGQTTWYYACNPADGMPLGSDW